MTLLTASGITVRYGGVVAVSDVDLSVSAGQIVGIIGPNGAGKSSLIDALSGFTRCAGTVILDGVDISRYPVHRRALAGLSRTWQSVDLFADITVGENLRVVPTSRTGHDAGLAHRDPLELLGIADCRDLLPSELPLGKRKLVGVARALAGRPRIICMDEPAAGLDSRESTALGRTLREIADDGTAVVLIDHDMDMVVSTCDVLNVLDFGTLVASGPPGSVRRDPAVLRAYLGETHEATVADHD